MESIGFPTSVVQSSFWLNFALSICKFFYFFNLKNSELNFPLNFENYVNFLDGLFPIEQFKSLAPFANKLFKLENSNNLSEKLDARSLVDSVGRMIWLISVGIFLRASQK